MGVGLVLTSLLPRREETWADRHMPSGWREWPDSLQSSFHNLATSIRDLPSTLARGAPHR